MASIFYNHILQEDPIELRKNEWAAFQLVIDRLIVCQQKSIEDNDRIAALELCEQLWSILLQDLISDKNALPKDLRKKLISIGLWIIKECSAAHEHRSRPLDSLIEINQIVQSGLN